MSTILAYKITGARLTPDNVPILFDAHELQKSYCLSWNLEDLPNGDDLRAVGTMLKAGWDGGSGGR
jgi:hypothetical protein